MSKFSGPDTVAPRQRVVAPAAFSHQSTGALALTDMVAGADLCEDAQKRARRMMRPGTVPPAPHRSAGKAVPEAGALKKSSSDKTVEKKTLQGTPWWVQNSREIYISQKIRHQRKQKVKDDAANEELLAHEALCRQRAEAVAERTRAHAAAERAASIPMPVKIEQMVVISKMRNKDIKRDISNVNKRLQAAATKRQQDKQTLRSAAELIRLREEELMLTRERMVHIYRSASEAIVKQSQEIGGAEDEDLALFLDKKNSNAPLISEMVTHNEMRRASALYDKYNRIEELWTKLRAYAFTVGKVGLRRRRALAVQESRQREQYHQQITDSIYGMPLPDAAPKAPSLIKAPNRKPSAIGQSGTPPPRKMGTLGSPVPASPATGGNRKTLSTPQSAGLKGRANSSSEAAALRSPLLSRKIAPSSPFIPPPPPVDMPPPPE